MNNLSQLLHQIDDKQQLINRNRPLDQQQVRNLKEYFKIGLTYASNALEGSTLTESETKVVIEDGVTIGGKSLRDHLEAIGHARAFDFMWELAKRQEVTEADIVKLHLLCFRPSEGEVAGQYRSVNVIITGSQYNDRLSAHETVASDMSDLIKESKLRQDQLHPVEYAAWLHRAFIIIHPFADGNGRVARLLLNHALISRGYPPVIISPAFKNEYISALEQSHERPQVFTEYIAEQVLEAQKDYIRLLRLS
ncbi:MAG: ibpA [Firmicutes bacterium]|nr:ibpA [Bacillota bacterium]